MTRYGTVIVIIVTDTATKILPHPIAKLPHCARGGAGGVQVHNGLRRRKGAKAQAKHTGSFWREMYITFGSITVVVVAFLGYVRYGRAMYA